MQDALSILHFYPGSLSLSLVSLSLSKASKH